MTKQVKFLLLAGILNGFLFVGFSAFGAHALQSQLSIKQLAWFDTASLYQIIHALALIGLALYSIQSKSSLALTGSLFLLGIILFSGSLYMMALGGSTRLGMITPIGGMCFLAAWLCWGWEVLKFK